MENETQQRINAQAAAWLARLHSEARLPADEAGFQAWVTEDDRHRAAFEKLTMMWDAATGDDRGAARPGISRRAVLAGSAVAALAAVGGGWAMMGNRGSQSFETALGEQRKILLDDGTRLTLDTGTRLVVAMGDQRRTVDLLSGRAHFDVAKDSLRPFVVTAGDRQVVAVGTAFDVARHGDEMSVTMVEGKVVVHQPGQAVRDRTVIAGDRLRLGRVPDDMRQDRPDVLAATAWQGGRAVFDNTPLNEAIAELNRYDRRQLVIADPAVGDLRISGSYETGASEAFASSIAELLPVAVSHQPGEIVLNRK